ncbi:hypothetical protein BB561_006659 [Smittium simulii]|uniref:WD repeat-containing protein JIP5 n=1 Tax=Smittium simulii TaxID=133385 RepID=A0A2T9Y2I8_9FUNG|nr:hypothetical protein BB561_006659 [Smittium simulii]
MDNPIKPIKFTEQIFDISLHPSNYLIASGLLTGHLFVHQFSNLEATSRIYRNKLYQKSCRAVSFSTDGKGVYSASKNKTWSFLDLNSQKISHTETKAHTAPINKIESLNEQIICTGDDEGCVKLWDIRQKKTAFTFSEHVDYISSFSFNENKRHLISTSGDGCMSVYDIRKSKPIAISENQDDELTCSAVMKNGSKIAIGSQSGVLGIFSYGMFSDVTDRFPGNPSSIEHMCKISQNCLITAGGDGYLRVLNLFPHSYTKVFGQHGSLPLEKIVTTFDKNYLQLLESKRKNAIGLKHGYSSDPNSDSQPDLILNTKPKFISTNKNKTIEVCESKSDNLDCGQNKIKPANKKKRKSKNSFFSDL